MRPTGTCASTWNTASVHAEARAMPIVPGATLGIV
jgi:hypothetical protein